MAWGRAPACCRGCVHKLRKKLVCAGASRPGVPGSIRRPACSPLASPRSVSSSNACSSFAHPLKPLPAWPRASWPARSFLSSSSIPSGFRGQRSPRPLPAGLPPCAVSRSPPKEETAAWCSCPTGIAPALLACPWRSASRSINASPIFSACTSSKTVADDLPARVTSPIAACPLPRRHVMDRAPPYTRRRIGGRCGNGRDETSLGHYKCCRAISAQVPWGSSSM